MLSDLGVRGLSLLLFWTGTILVCLLRSLVPDDQPLCVSFLLVRDKVCVLVWDKIFALVMDEISFGVSSTSLGRSDERSLSLDGACFWRCGWRKNFWPPPVLLDEDGVSDLMMGELSGVDVGWFPLGSGIIRPRPELSIPAFCDVLFHCQKFVIWDILCSDMTG
jgi:hypothetical protein